MDTIRVVIVDDHALVRQGLIRLLSAYPDIELVGTAGDGKGAITMVEEKSPDVLLLDISMPNLDGLSAIPRLIEASSGTRILLLSIHDEPEHAQAAIARGAGGLISKSASADDLYQAILAVSQGKCLPPTQPLTPRERQVLALINAGKTNEQIAESLSISVKTVLRHRQRLMERLDVHTQAGLIGYAKRIGRRRK
ncbi:MAG: response regulator transcription factor [Candidatus Bipolaricaulota bacterium]|nr:response regulator transcription factor [Candidatus Bipolaricaulota bacterium]